MTRKLPGSQLHFSNPIAHNDIYNHQNKWDKDPLLYRAFDMDTSTVCFTHYSDAKQRRDVLAPLFSRKSILEMQDLVQERVGCYPSDAVMSYQCLR